MEPWFGVRCVFRIESGLFEERITVWLAESIDDAIALAEADAHEYAHDIAAEYLGLAQAYRLAASELRSGTEVFSLMRESPLQPDEYLDAFFDSGTERQQS